MKLSRSIHVAANGTDSFFFQYSAVYHVFFIHSSIDGHLGCVHTLAIVNSAASEHWGACIFSHYVFSRYMSRSGIARSYGSSIFNFFKELPYCSPGFSGGVSDKESACQCRRHKRQGLDRWVGEILWRGNGTPLQYSCEENPTLRKAW